MNPTLLRDTIKAQIIAEMLDQMDPHLDEETVLQIIDDTTDRIVAVVEMYIEGEVG